MKYRLTLLFFSLFIGVALLQAQTPNRAFAPDYVGKRPGRVNLSNGFYWGEVQTTPASEALAGFLEKEKITVNRDSRSGKNILMRMREVESIPFIPRNEKNGYSLRIESDRVVIEYTSIQGLKLGCYQLAQVIRRESSSQGIVRKKQFLPCYEIRGWVNESNLITFRKNTPEAEPPLYATTIEYMLTDPEKGWLPNNRVLWGVGYTERLYTGKPVAYVDMEAEWRKWSESAIDVIPIFGLSESNKRFEEVTGHPMLSVEGMRFVRLLLDDFFTNTRFPAVGFIVSEERYRKQLEKIVSRYPHVTDLRFLDE